MIALGSHGKGLCPSHRTMSEEESNWGELEQTSGVPGPESSLYGAGQRVLGVSHTETDLQNL